MSFWRSTAQAWMTAMFVYALLQYPDDDWIYLIFLGWATSGLLWINSPDPIPAAVRKGLVDFAKEYRR